MLSTGLPVSRYVSVQVSLTTPAVIANAINNAIIITTDTAIDAAERMRTYYGISEVAREFGTDSTAWRAASLWFAQNPRPRSVMIGRWLLEPTPASLVGAILPPTEQAIALWRAVTDGEFVVTVNGTPTNITGLDFSAQTNLNGVATVINAALTGVTVKWTGQRFIFETAATGVGQELWFLADVDPATGTDISEMMRATERTATRRVDGQAEEEALSAVMAIDALYSSNFYGVIVPEADDEAQLMIAAYCEASDPVHYLGVTTADPNTLDIYLPNDPNPDLAQQLKDFSYNKTAVIYSTRSPYAICSYLAKMLVTDWRGYNTVPTMMYKTLPGVNTEAISSQQADVLQGKNCNVYASVANGANINQYGFSSSGQWTDTIVGADSLALAVQQQLFNSLYTTPTKIPMTDFGMNILMNQASATCAVFRQNGYLGPGVWNAPGFGQLETSMMLNKGYYLYVPSMGDQDPADRQARRAPLIMIAAKCASAIHTADVLIYVNE